MSAEPPEPHEFRTEEDENTFLIHVCGEIDLTNVFRLEDALKNGLKSGRGIIMDLHEVRYIDSTGLNLMFAYQTRAIEHGLRIVATEPAPNIRKVFEITRFSEVIPLVASIPAAAEMLRARRS